MYTIAALYHFTPLGDLAKLQENLKSVCQSLDIKGTLLLAHEGINGTVAGTDDGIRKLLFTLSARPEFEGLDWKISYSDTPPFSRMKVRLKKEIVAMGQPNVDPLNRVGRYVDPEDWNALIRSEDVVIIDTRNDYELAIGTFEGAVNPETSSFREFPDWWEKNKDRFANQRVAMFCTGGIRCEKSTSFLVEQGIDEVYHLKGGILKYLEDIPEDESTWTGACFVFDGRVSVEHGLKTGPHQLCHGCRQPILPEDVKRPEFEAGVSCHHCVDKTSDQDKARFRERQKQLALAKARGNQPTGQ